MSSPIIFEKGTRDFSTLGLGLLSDAIQATTTEELNGQFIFEMDYPASGNNADLIKENRIIVVDSGHILKRQGFIIRQIVRKIDLTMSVYAEHVSYATLDVALAPLKLVSGDATAALRAWQNMLVPSVNFIVDSDISTVNSTQIGAPEFETARQALGGHAGSILDVWGGEYQFNNWNIRLLKQRGKAANTIIAYGRNLISFEQDTNIADTYTSVYPYYQENSGDEGNNNHFLPERIINSEFVDKYPNPKVLMLDLSNKFKDGSDYSENKLRDLAQSYIKSNDIGIPKVNMKISTVDLSKATGGFSEEVDLGDIVNVYFEKLGITTSAKIIKAVWNVLSEGYDKFEIGARRASLTESISDLAASADENATKALNQALNALQSADGKTTIYYLDSSDPWPTNPKENDTAFVKDGENSIMYRYMFNNETGVFSWVKILDSMSADQIKQRVSDALESGKAYSDQLVADNVAQVNAVLDDVQAKQADLTAQQAELDTKAQGYANQALADAKADTQATAQQTAQDAQTALNNAETTLQQEISQKVSQSDYDEKTGDLSLKVSATQQTADQANTTIGNYKQSNDGRVSAAESKSEQNSHDITTKVSQTDYNAKTGELSGQISSVSQTAGEISQSVSDVKTQVDGLSVGGRNLYLNSRAVADSYGGAGTITVEPFDSNTNMWHVVSPQGQGWVGPYLWDYGNGKIPDNSDWAYSADVKGTATPNTFGIEAGSHNPIVGTIGSDWSRISQTGRVDSGTRKTPIMYFDSSLGPVDVYIKLPKLETGNMPTDWTPAPEDTENKISTMSQTVDGISSIVSDPSTGLSARVQTAEGNISTVQNNVSGIKTQQTQTANQLTTEISDRQAGDSNTLIQAKDFTTDSIIGYNSGMQSQLLQTADSIVERVESINLINNSEFDNSSGQFSGWHVDSPWGKTVTHELGLHGMMIASNTEKSYKGQSNSVHHVFEESQSIIYSDPVRVSSGGVISGSITNANPSGSSSGVGLALYIRVFDKDKQFITDIYAVNLVTAYDDWRVNAFSNAKIPMNGAYVSMAFIWNAGVGYFSQPMLQFGQNYTGYVPNIVATSTVLSLLKDNWSIGITDNTGALASGIFGDINGMALNGNTVTINANQTVITGTAFIKDAMIDYISASKLTVGNLDADKVRIINLDVNTLTGDVSRFLETNWDGTYGSTKITSAGMKINTKYIQADFKDFGMEFSYSDKKVGGIGILQYVDGTPGLAMRLDGDGGYMSWSARNKGDTTGTYINKLGWFRQENPALGGNYGFIFEDRVTFNHPINVEGTDINLGFRPVRLYGNNFPFFGNPNDTTGLAYTSNEIYMLLKNEYINLSNVIKSLSGIGAASIPTKMNADGTVAEWLNVTL